MEIELFNHNDKLFKVIKRIKVLELTYKDGSINNKLFNAWKEHLNADKVLKTQTDFLFCNAVDDLEWEEIQKEEIVDRDQPPFIEPY